MATKPQYLVVQAFLVSPFLSGVFAAEDPVRWVNPLIGTESTYHVSHGNVYPAVARPFGMTAWTPQTSDGRWTYSYEDEALQGFRATHQPSPWMGDYGRVTVMPMVGEPIFEPEARASEFKHFHETSEPNYYAVDLPRYDTHVEMTATMRSGFFRFTFPETDDAVVLLDIFRRGARARFDPEANRIVGHTRSNMGGVPDNFALYFVATFDRPFEEFGAWVDGEVVEARLENRGDHVRAYARFATDRDQPLHLRIGTSFISLEQAERNLAREIDGKTFDEVVADGRAGWNERLRRIELEGASKDQRTIFYTGFYRTLLFPRIFHEPDENGIPHYYSPFDGRIHKGVMSTDNGFWDTFRAVYPFFTLLYPGRVAEIIRGLVAAYEQGGWMPRWMSPGYRGVMIGTHTSSVIADAYRKGIRDFDVETAFEGLLKDATDTTAAHGRGRAGLESYQRLGYVPSDELDEATARTLEYAYGDWTVAQMAKALGRKEDHRFFLERSLNYRNVFDPEVGFMRGRLADGSWRPNFDPTEWGGPFTEGAAWHYNWSVMHDPEGLIALYGGREAFLDRLDAVFTTPAEFRVGTYGKVIHEMTEMVLGYMGQYAHANQPIQHAIYLYNHAGQPWKTQLRVREVMERLYGPGPDGLPGDEDQGQTSVWYLFSSLGLYPTSPGEPYYALGSPLFPRAVLHLPNGETFTIEAPQTSDENKYVQSVRLNGEPHANNWISHEAIASGGILSFEMGPEPNREWGSRPEDRPYSVTPVEAEPSLFDTTE